MAIFKRILSSDWLPERINWVHHARLGLHGLSLRKKENCSERTYRRVRKLWTVSATESQKAVEDGQNKYFLIFNKTKYFFYVIDPLLTKLVRLRWIDIGYVLFSAFLS